MSEKTRRKLKVMRQRFRRMGKEWEEMPVVGPIIRKSKTVSFVGLQQMPLYDVMQFYMMSLGKGIIFQRAAALTYRVFIALIPMLIALFSAIAFLGSNVQTVLLEFLQSLFPTYAWPAIENVVTDVITRQNGTLSSFMLFFGIYFAVLCMNGILVALNTSFLQEKRRNFIKQLGMSFVLMFIFFITIVTVVLLFIFSAALVNRLHHRLMGESPNAVYYYAIHGIKWLLTFGAIYFMVSVTYHIASGEKKSRYRFFSAGSTTCTLLMVVLLWGLNVYFSNFSNYNLIYGSLGALFAILLWLNWSSLVLLIGYELNVSIAKAKSTKTAEQNEDKTAVQHTSNNPGKQK